MTEEIKDYRDFGPDERQKLADSGAAMPDGSFPIVNRSDLENAIRAIGRAKDPAAAKAHIKKRAAALGATDMLPDSWNESKSEDKGEGGEKKGNAANPEPKIYQSLDNVEIFRTGEWNGDEYSVDDLQEMVDNFAKVGYDVPVKVGHTDDSSEPAYGWVSSLKLVGDRLVANLRDLPAQIYDAIANRRFDAVSSEVFWNLKRNGETFKRALKAVSLLGAETPAVAGLKPLRESLRGFSAADLSTLHAYTLTKGEIMADVKKGGEQQEPAIHTESGVEVKKLQEQVDALTAKLLESEARSRAVEIDQKVAALKIASLREHFRSLYSAVSEPTAKVVAFSVKDGDATKTVQTPPVEILDDLMDRLNQKYATKLFGEVATGGYAAERPADAGIDPGLQLDKMAKSLMSSTKGMTYAEAMKAILADPANDELKRAYARAY